MFLDNVKIKISSGAGGNGAIAWRREKYVDMGGPAGGDGGKGGSVYLIADSNLSTLLDFKYKSSFKADTGEYGRSKNMHGRKGNDLYIKVPCGTIVKDFNTDKIIADLAVEGQSVLVAQGGRGGRGNARFVNSIKQSPHYCEPGEPGIERDLELELKLIADVGLLGLPNAGKSTLISVISAAKPKIADYPFTTLVPNLGVVKKPNGDGFVVADVPGLIEGASEGVGLGLDFLRHVERTRLLLHLVDISAEDPIHNYKVINNELQKYGGKLTETPQAIVINKIDTIDEELLAEYIERFKEFNPEVFAISAATKTNIQSILNYLYQKVEELPQTQIEVEIEEDLAAVDNDDSDFEVFKTKDCYNVVGGKVKRLVAVTNMRDPQSIFRLQNILKVLGVFIALENAGIKDGEIVKIGSFEFEYYSEYFTGELEDEG